MSDNYPKLVTYPAFLNTAADIVGTLRDLTNLEMNEKAARFRRGDRNSEVNRLGLRGELIAQYVCHQNNQAFDAAPLLSIRPIGEPDIIVGKFRFDVKTVRSDAPDLLVNEEAHAKAAKGITHYWFFQQTSGTCAKYWIFPYRAVTEWRMKNVKYSNARFYPLTNAGYEPADETLMTSALSKGLT